MTLLLSAGLLAVALGLVHMVVEDRASRRTARPVATRPTVTGDWRRPDVVIGLNARGELVSQEIGEP